MSPADQRALAMRRRQLNREVAAIVSHPPTKPTEGWIASIRHALGMTGPQLARRMGIKQPSLAELERAEADGRITLDRINRAARALGCHVVYAVVPDGDSFDDIVDRRAKELAAALVGGVADTMALEDQSIDIEEQRARIAEVEEELRRSPRTLWSDPR